MFLLLLAMTHYTILLFHKSAEYMIIRKGGDREVSFYAWERIRFYMIL